MLGLHMVGGSTGFALGPILGGLIANILGWRFAFIILSIPALVAAPLVLRKFRLSERANNGEQLSQALISKDAPVKATSGFSSIVKALRPIAVVCALTILAQLIVGCAMAFFPLYLVDKHGILAAYAAMWLGVVRGGGMAGSLLGGWLSDKWGRKNVVLLSIITVGPALYLITLLPFNIALIAVFVLFGIIVLMRQPAIQTLLLDTAPAQHRTTVIGFYFFLSMEGMSLVQPVAGHFMDAYGIVRVFNVIALISVGLSVVALLWVIRSKLSR